MKRVGVVLLAVLCTAFLAHAQVEKVGVDILKSYETPHPYPAAQEGSKDLVWTDVITFAGATYIAPHFSRFHLADNDYVIIRSPDGSRSWRYEKLGKADLGETADGFWGIHINGDTAIVELHGRSGSQFGYKIDRFARGYRQEEMVAPGPESVCGGDDSNWAKCYQGSEPVIYDHARAIARLLIQGSAGCTGWLVGNAGHMITNFHCIGSAADALNTDYEFMAEGATCGTDCSAQLSCPGTIVSTTATAVQLDQPLDYALVLIPGNPSNTYGFLKMRNGPAFVDERIYLPGHPGIKGKRIAVNSSDATDQSGFCEIRDFAQDPSIACIPSATQLDTGYHCDTEGGSSGTPVIAYSDHKVVSLHHCGGCPNSGVQIMNVITSLGANVPPGSVFDPVGTVTLDRDKYACSATVTIEVKDDNLVGAGTQNVTIHSTTEPLNETVVLAEAPASSGKFVGTIATTAGAPANGDGFLSVTDGDTITVTYVDLDDGNGQPANRTDTALVDCIAPVITNVQAINVTGISADILWDTNEPASSLVTYGPASSPPPTSTTSSAALVTSHSVHLTGLLPCRAHIYKVASSDAAGNSAQNDNGGAYYTFTTGANTTPTYTSPTPPIAIPDNNPGGVVATINVPDLNTITDLDVRVKITHSYDNDLTLTLTSPGNQTISLVNRRGADGNNFDDTVLDDSAATAISAGAAPFTGSFRPEQALSAYNGQSAAGVWTLKVTDAAGLDTGTIDKFELIFAYPAQSCGVPNVQRLSHTVTDSCSGSGAGNANGVVDPGEDLTIPVTLANTGTGNATSITATLSTSTPNVTVTQSSASYGTLGQAQSGPGDVPYTVRISDSVPCGTLVTLNIHAVANEGSWDDSFTVRVGAPSSATNTYTSTNVPRPIPDNVLTTSTLTVSDTSLVTDVDVNLTLTHSYDSDLSIALQGPNGTIVPLATARGGSLDNYTNTTFDDSAATPISAGAAPFNGTFRPESPLSALNGIPANGTWTLRITDSATDDTGNLTAWKIVLSTQSGFTCNNCTPLGPPPEVLNLNWPDKTTATWSSAAGATEYRLYRGVSADLPKLHDSSMDSCRRATTASLSQAGLGENPSPTGYYWWVVRAANAGGEGPAGDGRIQDSSGICP